MPGVSVTTSSMWKYVTCAVNVKCNVFLHGFFSYLLLFAVFETGIEGDYRLHLWIRGRLWGKIAEGNVRSTIIIEFSCKVDNFMVLIAKFVVGLLVLMLTTFPLNRCCIWHEYRVLIVSDMVTATSLLSSICLVLFFYIAGKDGSSVDVQTSYFHLLQSRWIFTPLETVTSAIYDTYVYITSLSLYWLIRPDFYVRFVV